MLKNGEFEREKLLDKLYDARNVELWALTDEEKIENKEIIENNEINNKDLQIALSNLPNCFEEVCNNIKECVNKKIEGSNKRLSSNKKRKEDRNI